MPSLLGTGIVDHPDWPLLRQYIRVERYGRDTGNHGARVRLEVDRPADGIDLRRILAISAPCVACGKPIQVVRPRQGMNHLYLATTCPLAVAYRCARGRAARDEYVAIREAVEAWRNRTY